MQRLPFFTFLFVLIACGGSSPPVAPSSDAGASSPDSGGGAVRSGDGGSGGSPMAVPCPIVTPPPSASSAPIVRFNLTNTSNAPRWVLYDGQFCDGFAIDGVTRSVGYYCDCNAVGTCSDCKCPTPPVRVFFDELSPGESTTLEWAALRAVRDAMQAIEPGAYVARFVVATDAPPLTGACRGFTGAFDCDVAAVHAEEASVLCDATSVVPTAKTIEQPFTVPASGAVDVTVSIP